jgi:hypothetical protein
LSYENLNRRNDAVESYQRYLELTPDAPDAQQMKERIRMLTASAAAESRPPSPPAAADGIRETPQKSAIGR